MSTCSFYLSSQRNVSSETDYVRYRVFSLGDYSEDAFNMIEILDTDDAPILCLYSRGEEFPECGESGCIGEGTPSLNFITPISHQERKPVIFFDEINGDCYHSTSTASFSISTDSSEGSLQFGYIYVTIDEDSTDNAFSLRAGRILIPSSRLVVLTIV